MLIHIDTKEAGKRDINLCLFAVFSVARSSPKKPVYSTVRSERFSHYLIILCFGSVLTLASCFLVSADHPNKNENYFILLEALLEKCCQTGFQNLQKIWERRLGHLEDCLQMQ